MENDLSKLRRFSLGIGLLLLLYTLADVEFLPNETVRPFGLPLKISNPLVFDWILI